LIGLPNFIGYLKINIWESESIPSDWLFLVNVTYLTLAKTSATCLDWSAFEIHDHDHIIIIFYKVLAVFKYIILIINISGFSRLKKMNRNVLIRQVLVLRYSYD